nr:MAG TPA: hypothetical protein [Caudoviricetes sp.]
MRRAIMPPPRPRRHPLLPHPPTSPRARSRISSSPRIRRRLPPGPAPGRRPGRAW